ncbi:MAG: ribosomal protein [Candidatus Parcubacteria bacterium]|jgi:small subunit ribosomal protein S11
MSFDDVMNQTTDASGAADATTGEGTGAAKGKKGRAPAPKARRTKKKARQVSQGCAYIHATYNNTIVTLTDPNGNVLAWSSAGGNGFRGPKKSTPYAASVVVRRAAEKVADMGLKEVHVFMKGVGQGRESAVRALNANGLQVLSIKDMTPIPHNGCRPPRPRRV